MTGTTTGAAPASAATVQPVPHTRVDRAWCDPSQRLRLRPVGPFDDATSRGRTARELPVTAGRMGLPLRPPEIAAVRTDGMIDGDDRTAGTRTTVTPTTATRSD